MRRALGSLAALVAALLAALALAVGTALPAAAHAELETSVPARKATLSAAPARVTLTFTTAVRQGSAVLRVDGPGGLVASTGAPEVAGRTVTQPLRSGLGNGVHTIRWKVTSTDGHQLAGTIPFTLAAPTTGPTAAAATRTAPGTADPTATESAPSDAELTATNTPAEPPSSSPVVAALLLSALVLGGVVGVRRLRAGSGR